MSLQVRVAQPRDAHEITRLTGQLGYPISENETAQNIGSMLGKSTDTILVAELENEVVGWIHAAETILLEYQPYCEIGGLVVDERHRRMGIGNRLIDAVKKWARQKGLTILRVRSNTKRAEAHRFYQHAGFREIKVQKVFEIEI